MSEDRLIDIETKLAHLDQAMHELNAVVTRHQENLTRLERLFTALTEQVSQMHEMRGRDAGDAEPPPHY